MLSGIDDPGKHSSATVLFKHYVSSVEYFYITLASPGRLYPCRWHHARDHTKSSVAQPTEKVLLAEPRIELEPDRLTSRALNHCATAAG